MFNFIRSCAIFLLFMAYVVFYGHGDSGVLPAIILFSASLLIGNAMARDYMKWRNW